MKKVTAAMALIASCATGSALALDGSARLGVGLGEFSVGGPSVHSTHLTGRVNLNWDSGLTAGLRYVHDDYDGDIELSYLTGMVGWTFLEREKIDVSAGLLLERLRGEIGGNSGNDNAYGAQLAFNYAPSRGVELGLELAYLQTDEDNEDVFDTVVSAEIDIVEDVALGLEYWARTIESSGSPDGDQDAITLTLGFDF
jgi:hypothetical protein